LSPTDNGFNVLHRIPKRFSSLRGDQRLAATPDCCRDHHWQLPYGLDRKLADGDKRRLGVQRIKIVSTRRRSRRQRLARALGERKQLST